MNDDMVIACADLVGRAGAAGFEIGYAGDENGPVEEARWYAVATYQGARLISDEHRSPTAAALGLAERLLTGATCRCTSPVSLSDTRAGCRWQLVGQRWEPGCDAAPVAVSGGKRGDVAAMRQALAQVPQGGNRAARRAAQRRRSQ
ncbi:hypothetical protein QQG74_09180 [Micromonospora sp. FIMYZ51]|uniref:hypothetical protein n=1 Tax=Micromonospora sp. FIMYZ51 TaxID=3051832 RepID=UPI00311EE2A7